jgi:hypothetical protein
VATENHSATLRRSLAPRYAAILALAALGVVVYAGAAQALGVRNASLAAITIMAVGAAAFRPRYAVAAVLLLWPLDVIGRVSPDLPWLTYSRLAIVGALAAVLISRWITGERLRWPTHLWALAGFLALGALGMVQTGLVAASMVNLVGILMPFAVLFMIVQVAQSRDDLRFLVWAVALSSLIPGLVGVLDTIAGQSFLGTANEFFLAGGKDAAGQPTFVIGGLIPWRITATFDGTANFARFCVFALAATIGLLPTAERRGRLVLLGLAALQLFCITNTFTRSAYVATAVVITTAILMTPRFRRFVWVPVAAVVAAAVVLAPRLASIVSASRLSSASDSGRFELWFNAAEAAFARPVLGYGFGNVAAAIGELAPREQEPHNLALEALLSAGVVGGALLIGYLLWLFGSVLRIKDADLAKAARPAVLMLATVLVIGLFTHGLYSDEIWITIGMAAAVLALKPAGTDAEVGKPA